MKRFVRFQANIYDPCLEFSSEQIQTREAITERSPRSSFSSFLAEKTNLWILNLPEN